MSLLSSFKEEIINPTFGSNIKATLTGLAPVDKIIAAAIGVVGMGSIALIAAVGLYKAPPLSSLSATRGYATAKKSIKGMKLLWDTLESVLRKWKPGMRDKFDMIDQAFDFAQAFLDKEEIGSLIHGDRTTGY